MISKRRIDKAGRWIASVFMIIMFIFPKEFKNNQADIPETENYRKQVYLDRINARYS